MRGGATRRRIRPSPKAADDFGATCGRNEKQNRKRRSIGEDLSSSEELTVELSVPVEENDAKHLISRTEAYEMIALLNSGVEPIDGEFDRGNACGEEVNWMRIVGSFANYGHNPAELRSRYNAHLRAIAHVQKAGKREALLSYLEMEKDTIGFALLVSIKSACESLHESFWDLLGKLLKTLKTSRSCWARSNAEENWLNKLVWPLVLTWAPLDRYSLRQQNGNYTVVKESDSNPVGEHEGWMIVVEALKENWRTMRLEWQEILVQRLEQLTRYWGWSTLVAKTFLKIMKRFHLDNVLSRKTMSSFGSYQKSCDSPICQGAIHFMKAIAANAPQSSHPAIVQVCMVELSGLALDASTSSIPIRKHCLDIFVEVASCFKDTASWLQQFRKFAAPRDFESGDQVLLFVRALCDGAAHLVENAVDIRDVISEAHEAVGNVIQKMIDYNSRLNGIGRKGNDQPEKDSLKEKFRQTDLCLRDLLFLLKGFVASLFSNPAIARCSQRAIFPLLDFKDHGILRLVEIVNLESPFAVLDFISTTVSLVISNELQTMQQVSVLPSADDEDFFEAMDPDELVWQSRISTILKHKWVELLAAVMRKYSTKIGNLVQDSQLSQNGSGKAMEKAATALSRVLVFVFQSEGLGNFQELIGHVPFLNMHYLARTLSNARGKEICYVFFSDLVSTLGDGAASDVSILRCLGLVWLSMLLDVPRNPSQPNKKIEALFQAVSGSNLARQNFVPRRLQQQNGNFAMSDRKYLVRRATFVLSAIDEASRMEWVSQYVELIAASIRSEIQQALKAPLQIGCDEVESETVLFHVETLFQALHLSRLLAAAKWRSLLDVWLSVLRQGFNFPINDQILSQCIDQIMLGFSRLGHYSDEKVQMCIRETIVYALQMKNPQQTMRALTQCLFQTFEMYIPEREETLSVEIDAEFRKWILKRISGYVFCGPFWIYENYRILLSRVWQRDHLKKHEEAIACLTKEFIHGSMYRFFVEVARPEFPSARLSYLTIFQTTEKIISFFGCSEYLEEMMPYYPLSVVFAGLCVLDVALLCYTRGKFSRRRRWSQHAVAYGKLSLSNSIYQDGLSAVNLPSRFSYSPETPNAFIPLLYAVFESGSFGRGLIKRFILPELGALICEVREKQNESITTIEPINAIEFTTYQPLDSTSHAEKLFGEIEKFVLTASAKLRKPFSLDPRIELLSSLYDSHLLQ